MINYEFPAEAISFLKFLTSHPDEPVTLHSLHRQNNYFNRLFYTTINEMEQGTVTHITSKGDQVQRHAGHIGWHLNHYNEADIYYALNSFPYGSHRKKRTLSYVRPFIALDIDDGSRVANQNGELDYSQLYSYIPFKPIGHINTSPGKFQVIYHVKDLATVEQQIDLMKLLAETIPGADRAVAEPARLLRLPGYRHNKSGQVATWHPACRNLDEVGYTIATIKESLMSDKPRSTYADWIPQGDGVENTQSSKAQPCALLDCVNTAPATHTDNPTCITAPILNQGVLTRYSKAKQCGHSDPRVADLSLEELHWSAYDFHLQFEMVKHLFREAGRPLTDEQIEVLASTGELNQVRSPLSGHEDNNPSCALVYHWSETYPDRCYLLLYDYSEHDQKKSYTMDQLFVAIVNQQSSHLGLMEQNVVRLALLERMGYVKARYDLLKDRFMTVRDVKKLAHLHGEKAPNRALNYVEVVRYVLALKSVVSDWKWRINADTVCTERFGKMMAHIIGVPFSKTTISGRPGEETVFEILYRLGVLWVSHRIAFRGKQANVFRILDMSRAKQAKNLPRRLADPTKSILRQFLDEKKLNPMKVVSGLDGVEIERLQDAVKLVVSYTAAKKLDNLLTYDSLEYITGISRGLIYQIYPKLSALRARLLTQENNSGYSSYSGSQFVPRDSDILFRLKSLA